MKFEVVKGNIVHVGSQAVVLPANEKLLEGSGVSAAIFEAAGRKKLRDACAKIGQCNVGSAVPTSAFDMNTNYIIHAVVPRWEGGQKNEYGLLSSAYLSALHLADVMCCKSIAFPVLASGNNGFDRDLAVEIAAKSIDSFEGENLEEVLLVVYGEEMEDFIKSLGYDVTTMIEPSQAHMIAGQLPDHAVRGNTKQKVEQGLQLAFNWLKEKENQKRILNFGFEIAAIVFAKKSNAIKVVNALRNLFR